MAEPAKKCCNKPENDCAGPSNHDHHNAKVEAKENLCVGVIQGSDIFLFDVSGKSRTFTYTGNTENLCFDSHETAANSIPCLDSNGNHLDTDPGCVCGEMDPHVHAHSKERCQDSDTSMEVLKLSKKDVNIPISEQMPKSCNAKLVKLKDARKKLYPVR